MKKGNLSYLGKAYWSWDKIDNIFKSFNCENFEFSNTELVDFTDVHVKFKINENTLKTLNVDIEKISELKEDIEDELNERLEIDVDEMVEVRLSEEVAKSMIEKYMNNNYIVKNKYSVEYLEGHMDGVGVVFDIIEEDEENIA